MGRSVETPNHATAVVYLHDSIDDSDDWDDLIDDLQQALGAKYPSFQPVKAAWLDYPYRETRIILANRHAQVTISEYCGLVAVCLVPIEQPYDYGHETGAQNLADSWCARIEPGFREIVGHFGHRLAHVGTASNGEAFYRYAEG